MGGGAGVRCRADTGAVPPVLGKSIAARGMTPVIVHLGDRAAQDLPPWFFEQQNFTRRHVGSDTQVL